LKVAVFVDYIGAIGGGERVALMLAHNLKEDLIRKYFDETLGEWSHLNAL